MRLTKYILVIILCVPIITYAAPKLTIDKERHDYGRVLYGDTVKDEFVIKNTGDQPLKIDKLEASCGCTKVIKGASEIPPNGETKIFASFDTNGLSGGKKQKSITVYSNDPERPVVKLALLADVIREVSVEPRFLAAKIPEFKQTVDLPFKITNDSDMPLMITKLAPVQGFPEVKMAPEQLTLKPHSTIPVKIEVSLKKTPGKEYYIGRANLETNHPREKEIQIRYTIKLDNPA